MDKPPKQDIVPTPDSIKPDKILTKEQGITLQLADWKDQIKKFRAEGKEKREAGPEVALLREMIEWFKSQYSLDDLNALTMDHVTPATALEHPLRGPANLAIVPIAEMLNMNLNPIYDSTNISPETYNQLMNEYLPLSYAIGKFNYAKNPNGELLHMWECRNVTPVLPFNEAYELAAAGGKI